MARALFVGRFQPFHNGHLQAVKAILKECDELVIAIGSSQKSHERDNLFTVGERIEMIYESVKAEGLAGKCIIVAIPDVNNNALWAKHLITLSPSFDVAYSNNALVRRLFKEDGVKVKSLEMVKRDEFDGTIIRRIMLKGGDWEKLIPGPAAKVAKKLKAQERLREITESDKA